MNVVLLPPQKKNSAVQQRQAGPTHGGGRTSVFLLPPPGLCAQCPADDGRDGLRARLVDFRFWPEGGCCGGGALLSWCRHAGIWSAAMDGDLQRATALVRKGVDPNQRDSAGYTALVSGQDTSTSCHVTVWVM